MLTEQRGYKRAALQFEEVWDAWVTVYLRSSISDCQNSHYAFEQSD